MRNISILGSIILLSAFLMSQMFVSISSAEGTYSIYTEAAKADVESEAAAIRQAVLDKDWEAFARYVEFPISVKDVTYEDEEEFLKADWNDILSDAFFFAVAQEACQDMYVCEKGIVFGNGQIWLAEVNDGQTKSIKVVEIND